MELELSRASQLTKFTKFINIFEFLYRIFAFLLLLDFY